MIRTSAKSLGENLDIRTWNDKMADKYNPELYHKKSFFVIRLIEKLRAHSVLELLAVKDKEQVLDIGCGAGNIMEYFSRGRLFGIDLCKHLLMAASQKKYKVPLCFIQSFAEELPFKSSVFDKVYCSEVIEHIKEPHLVIKEAQRVMREDGYFIVSIPNEGFINFIKTLLRLLFLDRIINSISTYKYAIDMVGEWHLHKFSLEYIENLLEGSFYIKIIRYIPFRVFPLQIVLVCRKKYS